MNQHVIIQTQKEKDGLLKPTRRRTSAHFLQNNVPPPQAIIKIIRTRLPQIIFLAFFFYCFFLAFLAPLLRTNDIADGAKEIRRIVDEPPEAEVKKEKKERVAAGAAAAAAAALAKAANLSDLAKAPAKAPKKSPMDYSLVDAMSEPLLDDAYAGINPRWDKYAIALKTGADTAAERASVQFVTFLSHVRNIIIIGESAGVFLGGRPVADVYSNVYDRAQKRVNLKKANNGTAAGEVPLAAPVKPPMIARRALDKIKNVESSLGWKLDAHKNLPGFQLLYTTYPDADWYVMIDDDTYLFMTNLDNFLKGKDPEEPFYTGNANVFVGCDGVRNFGEGPSFAHGGSGIVMSRGAMKKMMSGLEECVLKYKDCWAGDIRVALCLRDAGILLSGGPNFWGDPPNKDFQFPGDPCTEMQTFHHVVQNQIQKLYEVEVLMSRIHRQLYSPYSNLVGTVTAGDVYNHMFKTSGPIKGMDRPGHDLENVKVTSPEDCEGRCKRNKGCTAWVLDPEMKCWLKDVAEEMTESPGMWTGTVAKDYKCKIPE
ncbi:hypothetical protein HK101_004933 [Irineochytrium annulatum]|nr:hypothetical protein HK101_004933 [Irineochytrium annulatum]